MIHRPFKIAIFFIAIFILFSEFSFARFDRGVIDVIESNESRIIFELNSFEINFDVKVIDGVKYELPRIEGYDWTTAPGKPQLPVKGILIGIPENAVPTIQILDVQTTRLESKIIFPAPTLELKQGEQGSYPEEQFYFDQKFYSQNNFYPANFAAITEISRFRHQRIARLEFHPLQYNPATRELLKVDRLKVAVYFNGAARSEMLSIRPDRFEKSDPFETIYNNLLVNFQIAKKWRHSQSESIHLQNESGGWFNPNGTYYKLFVDSTGIYRLDFSYLENLGIDARSINPATFRLYNKGQEVPLYVTGQADGRFDQEDFIEFYGQKNYSDSTDSDPYTDTNIYWLTWGGEPGLRFNSRNSLKEALPEITDYVERLHIEQDHDYYSGDNDYQIHNTELVDGEGWVWRFFFPGEKETITIPLSNKAESDQPTRLISKLRGTTLDPIRPNHHVKIFLNDEVIGDIYFTGTETKIFETTVPKIKNGENKLMIHSVGDTGAKIDQIYLDWIDLEYPRQFYARNEQLEFAVTNQNSNHQFSIWGFSDPQIQLFDLTTQTKIESTIIQAGKKVSVEVFSAGFNDGNLARILINSTAVIAEGSRGHNLAVVDEITGELLDTSHFDTYESSAEADQMARYIQNLPNGRIVLAAIRDEGSAKMTENAYKALESLGSRLARTVRMRDSWAMIGKKGAEIGSAIEKLTSPGTGAAMVQEQLLLPGSGQDFYVRVGDAVDRSKKYIAVSEKGLLQPVAAELDTSANLRDTRNGADLIIITHEKFWDGAQRLAQYRASQNGLRVRVVDVQEIYDEFNYGLLNPQAIKDFLKHTFSFWQAPAPNYVIFFGDASWDFKKNLGDASKENYVPSYGNPVSDNWYVCFDGPNDVLPEMLSGRIPVESAEQAEMVVDKIIAYEHSPSASWKKNVLFITGGFNRSEQALFMSQTNFLVNQYVVPPPASCRTLQINKTTEGYFEGEKKQEVLDAINGGTMWVNFLGHAGSRTWDLMFNHPDIEELTNNNLYPFITSMTCHTGRFANPEISSFGEHFLITENKGAIAFWGTTGWGYIFQDNILLKNLFQGALVDTIHSLGEATTSAKLRLWEGYGGSTYNINVIQQYTLLGDPLVDLALPEKSDLTIGPQDVSFFPTAPSEADSTVAIKIKIQNWGLATNDSVTINIYDVRGNESVPIISSIRRPRMGLEDSLTVHWKLKDQAGEHVIRFVVDQENEIDEVNEENNRYDFLLYIYSSKITISKPIEFQVVLPQQVTLQVNNPAMFFSDGTVRFYQFEVDTSSSFNSPLLISSPQIPEGKIVTKWRTPALADTSTYFWRCRSITGSEIGAWVISSFTTRSSVGQEIWHQKHRGQFTKNKFDHTQLAVRGARLEAREFIFQVESAGNGDGNYARILVNSIPVAEQRRGHNLAIIKPNTGQMVKYQSFDTWASTNQADSMADFINSLETGSYALIAIRDDGSLNMTESAYQALESIGSRYCRNVRFRDSWAIVGIKGAPIGSVTEKHSPATQGIAMVQDTLINYPPQGTMTSPPIGPATAWNFVFWTQDVTGSGANIMLDVLGFNKKLAQWETLYSGISNFRQENLTEVNVKNYPLIKLRANLFDDDGLDTPFLKDWSVAYVPVADPAIAPNVISLNADTLLENDALKLETYVYNVGMIVADTVKLRFSINTPDSGKIKLGDDKILTDILVDSFQTINQTWILSGRIGNNQIFVEVDPDDQLNELTETNNYFSAPIVVLADTAKPQIVVSYDGKGIVAGDYVAKQPIILVDVYDDSPIFIANDTTKINLFIDNSRIAYLGNEMQFIVLTMNDPRNPKLKAQVRFTPELADGDHSLEVFVKDLRNNSTYHRDDFQVVSEFDLLNILNYPNPFQQETEFTFHLTQPAAQLTIKIFTIAGRLIRTLENHWLEAGFHRIHWNGLDQDQNEIANGVYLYKIIARSGKKQVERIEKLVIMR